MSLDPATGNPIQNSNSTEDNRGDVSAITIARMMGLATLGEVKLIENKVDLLSTKLSTVLVKLEKVTTVLAGVPTGADIERVDVQVGALRQMIREALVDQSTKKEGTGLQSSKKPGSNIQTNSGASEQPGSTKP